MSLVKRKLLVHIVIIACASSAFGRNPFYQQAATLHAPHDKATGNYDEGRDGLLHLVPGRGIRAGQLLPDFLGANFINWKVRNHPIQRNLQRNLLTQKRHSSIFKHPLIDFVATKWNQQQRSGVEGYVEAE
jgi:hypothetical protein